MEGGIAELKAAILADVHRQRQVLDRHGIEAGALHRGIPLRGRVPLDAAFHRDGAALQELPLQLFRHPEHAVRLRHADVPSGLVDPQNVESPLGPALYEIEETGLAGHRLEKYLELPFTGLRRDVMGTQRDALAPQCTVFPAIFSPEHGLRCYLNPPTGAVAFVETHNGGRVGELHFRNPYHIRAAPQPLRLRKAAASAGHRGQSAAPQRQAQPHHRLTI